MTDDYFVVSTPYSLGCLLAQKRRLLLDGVYSQLENHGRGLGAGPRDCLHEIEDALGRAATGSYTFLRYHRLALADSVLERNNEGWTVGTYIEFRRRYKLIRHSPTHLDQQRSMRAK